MRVPAFRHATIGLKEICPSSFNPPSRITSTAIRAVKESIANRGLLSEIHVIDASNPTGKYILVDGHRRYEVHRLLGWTHIQARVHGKDEDPIELWAELNSKTRSVNAFEWMVAWYRSGCRMKGVPAGPMGNIQRCLKVLGDKGIEFLISKETAPTMIVTVDRLCERLASLDLLGDIPRRRFAVWMVRHELSGKVKDALQFASNKRSMSKLLTRFNEDRGFELQDLLPPRKEE